MKNILPGMVILIRPVFWSLLYNKERMECDRTWYYFVIGFTKGHGVQLEVSYSTGGTLQVVLGAGRGPRAGELRYGHIC